MTIELLRSATNLLLIAGTLAMGLVCLHPKVLRSRVWHATVTPLASIIGSGFLVVGPILADTAGVHAWRAMAALCLIGFLYGAVARHNILHVEPNIGRLSRSAETAEVLSNFALALSYFVSVAYYLNLLAAFALRILGDVAPLHIRVLATCAIATIGLIGFRGGLAALERLEVGTVGLKLSVIVGLLLSLSLAFGHAWGQAALLTSAGGKSDRDVLRIVLGLIILVQGFETSRYLGDAYDPALRVRTMRNAQWISSAIYLAFVFLITHLFHDVMGAQGSETGIIDMLKPLGFAAAPLLIAAAVASQSSAAVADMNGAGGLLEEATRHRIPVRFGNLATAMAAIAITWNANIFEIITWASKSFVAYYALQSFQAARSAWALGQRIRAVIFASGIALALLVIVWAVPASA